MMLRYAVKGLLRTFRPFREPDRDYAAISARYSYSVFLRHLVCVWKCGQKRIPEAVVELGPGSSQGVGLSAVLAGARTYTSVDVVDYRFGEPNAVVLEELIELFRRRVSIPGPEEFPNLHPTLTDYRFPHEILTDRMLTTSLDSKRLNEIRIACRGKGSVRDDIRLAHYVIGSASPPIEEGSIDMVVAQGVLQYVPDINKQYCNISTYLKPGGFASSQNDYSIYPSFDRVRYWNSHWGVSDLVWNVATNRQLFVINREPNSAHVQCLKKHGLEIAYEQTLQRDGIPRQRLARRFRDLSDEDLTTSAAFIVATQPENNKPGNP